MFCNCSFNSLKKTKINGVSFVASKDSIHQNQIEPLLNLHANYAAIMPFGFIKNLNHPQIIYNSEKQWFGETFEGVKHDIKTLKKNNIKIMLKPQIWVWNGEFTGYIKMQNETDWKLLETSYANFILDYAVLAAETQTEILCIGTELEQFVKHRPKFWKGLIVKVKKVYQGKLTYAANWDEYKRTPFWNDLDYLGIDAYFPISAEKTPTVEACMLGWEPHKATIKTFYETTKKPILFTEFGYRSVDYSGKEPWKSDRNMTSINLQAQTNTTQALMETFWKEDWFAGGFVWKWFHEHEKVGGRENNQFTPQNKPAEQVIKDFYTSY